MSNEFQHSYTRRHIRFPLVRWQVAYSSVRIHASGYAWSMRRARWDSGDYVYRELKRRARHSNSISLESGPLVKSLPADQMIYSRHTRSRYCLDFGACDRRAKRRPA